MKLFKKSHLSLLLIICLYLTFVNKTLAIENPLSVANNPFGIHIIDENDLNDAHNLVNSSGGDWGYVTIVIREDERNAKRWQEVFDRMRRLHLIPIIRLATKQEDHGWSKPKIEEINNWVAFLNNLNWVVKNRYVIIGNEPNHASEWGGEINPEEYADYLATFSEKLKYESQDFYILNAALDASAPNNSVHMTETDFIKGMLNANPIIFDYVDGWNSHSYPNPDFSGSESASGQGSIRTFEWELNYIKTLGVDKNLPVFITETGWAHNMDGTNNGYQDTAEISEKLKTAYESAWKNDQIVAITPFVLNYQSPPFDKFSWKNADGSFYDFYYDIRNLEKPKGEPQQINSIETITNILPEIIKRRDEKYGLAYVKNSGQVIWLDSNLQTVEEGDKRKEIEPISFISSIEPNGFSLVFYRKL
jgi:hypothetical protein